MSDIGANVDMKNKISSVKKNFEEIKGKIKDKDLIKSNVKLLEIDNKFKEFEGKDASEEEIKKLEQKIEDLKQSFETDENPEKKADPSLLAPAPPPPTGDPKPESEEDNETDDDDLTDKNVNTAPKANKNATKTPKQEQKEALENLKETAKVVGISFCVTIALGFIAASVPALGFLLTFSSISFMVCLIAVGISFYYTVKYFVKARQASGTVTSSDMGREEEKEMTDEIFKGRSKNKELVENNELGQAMQTGNAHEKTPEKTEQILDEFLKENYEAKNINSNEKLEKENELEDGNVNKDDDVNKKENESEKEGEKEKNTEQKEIEDLFEETNKKESGYGVSKMDQAQNKEKSLKGISNETQ